MSRASNYFAFLEHHWWFRGNYWAVSSWRLVVVGWEGGAGWGGVRVVVGAGLVLRWGKREKLGGV